MRIFVAGASGYIGGSIAAHLRDAGHDVLGLVRSREKAERLAALGVEPVLGDLDDGALLARIAQGADATVNAASSDDRGAVDAMLDALEGSGRPFLHTSGASVVADRALGEAGGRILYDDEAFEPLPERAARAALDRAVVAAAGRGVRSVVLCNSLIYGRGLGLNPDSIQIPKLIEAAKNEGMGVHIGSGANVWSTVHVGDVVELYRLALERAKPGSFLFVENGEASFREMAQAIGRMLGFGGRTKSWPPEEAIRRWGERAAWTFGSNCRVRGRRARSELGWRPSRPSVTDEIERGSHRIDAR